MANQDQSVTAVTFQRQPLLSASPAPSSGTPAPQPTPLVADPSRRQELPPDNYYRLFPNDVHGIVRQAGGVEQPLALPAPSIPAAPKVNTDAVKRAGRNVVKPARTQLERTGRNVRRIANETLDGRERLDRVTPPGTRVLENVGALGRGVVKNTPASTPQRVRSAIAGLSTKLGSVLPRQSTFTHRLEFPAVYDDGKGTRLVIPAGAQVIGAPGSLRLTSPSGFLSAGGVTVGTERLDINLGRREHSAVLDRFRLDTSSTALDLQGLTTRLSVDGSFLARAESAAIDLGRGRTSIRLTGAEIASSDPATIHGGFQALAMRTPGVDVTTGVTDLSATTRDGVATWLAQTNNLDVSSTARRFHADSLNLNLQRDTRTGAGQLTWTGQGVRYDDGRSRFDAGSAVLGFTRQADGTSVLALRGRDLNVALGDRTFSASAQSSFEIAYDARGQLTDITARGDDVRYADKNTGLQATGAFLHTRFDDAGLVTSIDGGSERFKLATANGSNLDLTRGRIELSRDGEAVLLRASAASGRYTTTQGVVDLGRDGTLDMRMTRDLVTVNATASAFTYAEKRGTLAITNGRLEGTFGPGADRDMLRFTGDSVRYTGTTTPGQITDMTVNAATAEVTRDASGATRLAMSGRDFGMTVDGHRLTIANAQQVAVQTTPKGNIASIDAFLPGRSTLTSNNGDTRIGVEDLSARYTGGATEHLRLAFSRGEVDIKSLGLYGTATNVAANFRLDSQGRLAGARLDVGSLDGRYGDTLLRVNNREGESVRLVTRFSHGQFRDALLRIPQGGEVLVGTTDGALRLGQQVTRLSQGPNGSLRLQSRDFEAAGIWRDVTVQASGRNFDATLVGGDLRLNNIQGTNIAVRNGDWNVNVDVRQLDNLLMRASGISGLAKGAMLTLTPTADNSRLSATVTASYQGIPFSLRIDDARQLEALAMVRTNQAQVLVRDPSGQGQLRLAAGPLSIEGRGQVGAVVSYQPYNPALFTESVHGMLNDRQLGDHVRMNTSGAMSLGFYNPNDTFWGGVTVMPPRTFDPHADPLAGAGHQPLVPTDAIGAVVTAGVQRRNAAGRREAVGIYGGLVPGSTANVAFQGDARLYDVVPLPERIQIPSTVIGGLRFEREDRDGTWAALVGAQANVAGLVNSPYIREPAKLGGHMGLSYTQDNAQYSAAATYTPGGGMGFRLGAAFKF